MTPTGSIAPVRWTTVPPFPFDEALPELQRLVEPSSAWDAIAGSVSATEACDPDRVRIEQIRYQPGERLLVTYLVEKDWEDWVVDTRVSVEVRPGRRMRSWTYPDDPRLPGLPAVYSIDDASMLLTKYAGLRPRHIRIELVRYRAGSRSILRYVVGYQRSVGELHVYVRATKPRRLRRILTAFELVRSTGFVVPEVLGAWEEGGVAWMTGAPGQTLRELIHAGTAPAAGDVIRAMKPLWDRPAPPGDERSLSVRRGFEQTDRLLGQVMTDQADRELHGGLASQIRPFVEDWVPSAGAHNDLHDDQLIITPSGNVALVDFEEAGPGDPMLDVANMMAHLRWMASMSGNDQCDAYLRDLREAALNVPGFDEGGLAVREAYALFRLSSNAVMQALPNWPEVTKAGLQLACAPLREAGRSL